MVMIVAGMVLYCLLCIWLGMGAYAYVSVFAFPMGFWWRKWEKKIEALLSSRRRFWMSYAALFLVFCVTLIFGNLPIFTRAWLLAIRSVSAVAFVSVVLLTIRVVRIQFPVTEFLGEIYYEIYVIHGMFLNLFRNVIVVENDVLYIVLVFGCTFSSSYLLRPVIQRLSNRLKN